MDISVSLVSLVALLVGAILLSTVTKLPKLGGSIVLAGAVVGIIYLIYSEISVISNSAIIIPVGLILALIGGILGLTAKGPMKPAPIMQTADLTDKLVRLKRLNDEGAITQEEYEEQKRKLLENNLVV
jgi:ABC-type transport system involved in multi-copper enzyme maturation permease subunit